MHSGMGGVPLGKYVQKDMGDRGVGYAVREQWQRLTIRDPSPSDTSLSPPLISPRPPAASPMTCMTQRPEIRPHQREIRPLRSRYDVVHVHRPPPAPVGTLTPRCLLEHSSPQEAPGGRGVEGEMLGAAPVVGAVTGPTAAPTRDRAAMGQTDAGRGPGHGSGVIFGHGEGESAPTHPVKRVLAAGDFLRRGFWALARRA
jgi:hypothetical protein